MKPSNFKSRSTPLKLAPIILADEWWWWFCWRPRKKKKRDPVIMKRSERSDWLQNTKGDGDALRRFFSLDSFIFYFIFWTSSLPACYQVDGHIWVGFDLCPDARGPRKKTNKKYALDRQKRRIGKCTKHRRLQRESSERDSVQVKKESLYFSSFHFCFPL